MAAKKRRKRPIAQTSSKSAAASAAPRTKAERRQAALERAERLKAEQKAKERARRRMTIGAIIMAVGLIGLIVVFLLKQGTASPLEKVETTPANTSSDGALVFGPDLSAGAQDTPDVPVLTVYSDMACGACALFESVNSPTIQQLLADGKLTYRFHPVAILDGPQSGNYSTRAVNAIAEVAAGAPDRVHEFIAGLFAVQQLGPQTDEQLAQLAQSVGVSEAITATFPQATYEPWATAATQQAAAEARKYPEARPKGLATPFILINGIPIDTSIYDWTQPGGLNQAIEDAAAGKLQYTWEKLPDGVG